MIFMIALVVGTIGSGKGTVSRYIHEKGFESFSFGGVVREELQRRELSENREMLQLLGDQLKHIWAGRIIDKIGKDKDSVVDGPRYPFQIREFQEAFGKENVRVIGVDANYYLRAYRLWRRGREGDPRSIAEFQLQNYRDLYGHYRSNGQDTSGCMEIADYMIKNNWTRGSLKRKTEFILKDILVSRRISVAA